MMKEAVDETSQHSHRRIKNDQPSARVQHPMELGDSRARKLQVMPDIKEDEVCDRAILKTERIRILDLVEPGIGKYVRRQSLWHLALQIPDSRSDFHGVTGCVAPKFLRNFAIELTVDFLQERFPQPMLRVGLDLGVVLPDGNRH